MPSTLAANQLAGVDCFLASLRSRCRRCLCAAFSRPSAADRGQSFRVVAGRCQSSRAERLPPSSHDGYNVSTTQARISQSTFVDDTMSRGLDIDRDDRSRDEEERRVRESRAAHVLLRDEDERDPDRRSETVPPRDFALPDGRERENVRDRGWGYRLRDTESQTLVAAGTFRVVFERDLRDGPYRGDVERLAQDVKALRAQGLLERRTIASDDRGHSMGVLALTERGRALLEARRDHDPDDGPGQAIYAGWHKPAEVIHDASLYRMFQVEAAAIEDRGGRINARLVNVLPSVCSTKNLMPHRAIVTVARA